MNSITLRSSRTILAKYISVSARMLRFTFWFNSTLGCLPRALTLPYSRVLAPTTAAWGVAPGFAAAKRLAPEPLARETGSGSGG